MNQNVALIQKLYDAFGRGDVQTILNNLTADCEWILDAPSSLAYSGTRRGPAEVAGFFQGIGATEANPKLEVTQLFGDGDSVAGFGYYSATATSTGKSFRSPFAHQFRFRDGKVCFFQDFLNTAVVAAAHSADTSAKGA